MNAQISDFEPFFIAFNHLFTGNHKPKFLILPLFESITKKNEFVFLDSLVKLLFFV